MSTLTFLLFKLNTLQTKIVKLRVTRSHGVIIVVCGIYTTVITQRQWSQGVCFVTTQCHVVQINQSENRYSPSCRGITHTYHTNPIPALTTFLGCKRSYINCLPTTKIIYIIH